MRMNNESLRVWRVKGGGGCKVQYDWHELSQTLKVLSPKHTETVSDHTLPPGGELYKGWTHFTCFWKQ